MMKRIMTVGLLAGAVTLLAPTAAFAGGWQPGGYHSTPRQQRDPRGYGDYDDYYGPGYGYYGGCGYGCGYDGYDGGYYGGYYGSGPYCDSWYGYQGYCG